VAQTLPALGRQDVDVHANGRHVGVLSIGDDWSEVRLPLPKTALRRGRNGISLSYGKLASPHALGLTVGDHRELSARFRSIRVEPIPRLSDFDFGTPEARRWLLDGWSVDETEGELTTVWSVSGRASLLTNLQDLGNQQLHLRAHAFDGAMPLSVTVRINGNVVVRFEALADWTVYEIPVPLGIAADGPDLVEFEFSRTASPADLSGSLDSRNLALRFDRLSLATSSRPLAQSNRSD
jgi:hypothetical protein